MERGGRKKENFKMLSVRFLCKQIHMMRVKFGKVQRTNERSREKREQEIVRPSARTDAGWE